MNDFELSEAAVFYASSFDVWLHDRRRDDPRSRISRAVEGHLDWLLADHIAAGRVRAFR